MREQPVLIHATIEKCKDQSGVIGSAHMKIIFLHVAIGGEMAPHIDSAPLAAV
ncbi:hypothetical protein [Sphingobium tyrosinilyticum]|uniref:Uncharacterized protein n=1 Tax=Sphingobium tyrosinilyticum TaxID=2715436 RepID=A0ABV9F477_9SPHN